MTTPTPRTPVRPGRGTKANLDIALAASDIKEGELVYAKDQDKLYIVEAGVFVAAGGSGGGPTVTAINDLNDVDTASTPPTSGQVLTWDSGVSQWKPANGSSVSGINDLSDVDTVSNPPTEGQVLTWDDTGNQWKPADTAGAGRGDGGDLDSGTVGSGFVNGIYGGGDIDTGTPDLPAELSGIVDGGEIT